MARSSHVAAGVCGGGAAFAAPSAGPHQFPKRNRLRKRREFLAVQRAGRPVHGTYFVVVTRPVAGDRSGAPAKVGITVSKKVGSAVVRNRIKRLVREFVRQREWLPPAHEAVVIAKRRASELGRARGAAGSVACDLGRIGRRFSR